MDVGFSAEGLGTIYNYSLGPDEQGEFKVADIPDICMLCNFQRKLYVFCNG